MLTSPGEKCNIPWNENKKVDPIQDIFIGSMFAKNCSTNIRHIFAANLDKNKSSNNI
jgi:hypothetical protein